MLLVAVGAVTAVVIVMLGGGASVVRVLMVLPLVLVLPGYAFAAAMFPSFEGVRGVPEEASLTISERTLIVLSMSIAATVVLGFLINLNPGGFAARSWAYALSGFVLVCDGVAVIRRLRSPVRVHRRHRRYVARKQVLLSVLALGIVASAVVIGEVGAQQQPYPGFTEMWILPAQSTLSNSFTVGVVNQQASPQVYMVRIHSRHHMLYHSTWFTLVPRATWTRSLHLGVRRAGRAYVTLYRSQAPHKPYRTVFVHVVRNLSKTARPAIQPATLSVESRGANNFTMRVANRGTSSQTYLVVIRAHHHRLYHSPLFTVQSGGIRTFEVHLRVRHTGSARVRLYRSQSLHKPYKTVFVKVVQNKPAHGP